jgi:hypothetical protein
MLGAVDAHGQRRAHKPPAADAEPAPAHFQALITVPLEPVEFEAQAVGVITDRLCHAQRHEDDIPIKAAICTSIAVVAVFAQI